MKKENDTLELKDGILILEEGILQAVQNEDLYVLICGDLNARTGCEQPKQESMLNYSPSFDDDDDYDEGGGDVLYRYSMDKGVNNFGKSLLNLCFLLDCRIVNGSCSSDKCGDFTYVSPHGSSVIDYCVISSELFLLNCCDLQVGNTIDS